MRYYQGEKSVGLGPIILAMSFVAACGFGVLYYTCSHNIQPADATTVQPAAQPLQTSSSQENHV